MLRRLTLPILAAALLLAIEPVVHSHPLWENSDARTAATNGACAVCAAGVTQLPSVPPAVVAPVVVVSVMAAEAVSPLSASLVLTLPSRAPPAA